MYMDHFRIYLQEIGPQLSLGQFIRVDHDQTRILEFMHAKKA